ncbi:MAG: DUF5060 domain-containing protein [Bacteroidetes bacterium]|nr:MAG: DUF5060 domain-containing protein [Bacteroidota bacterium]
MKTPLLLIFAALIFSHFSCTPPPPVQQVQKWHCLTLSFEGPETSETADPNPFTDYRLMVHFRQGDKSYLVPGFYAADGRAAESSADSGRIWQVRFTPDEVGSWTYEVSFRQGAGIAISDDPQAGQGVYFDGQKGSFEVLPSDKSAPDLRAKGRLQYVGKRYLQFAETGAYYLKGGADSPENFLAYHEFDGPKPVHTKLHESREGEAPESPLHTYAPHVQDWQPGDPSWQGGKGKGIIGALNYLAGKGMNSVYFLTMNVQGDGNDVWPWTSQEERYRFDCSKLDQWEVVFSHFDRLGLMLHVVTQETENELLLDQGDTGPQRQLYYRELIARFGHHLAITWNLGEENGPADFTPNGQTEAQQRAMASYFKQHDPYRHFVALHTHAAPRYRDTILRPLLGFEDLDGPSMQISPPSMVHSETIKWLQASQKAGKQWVCFLDEIGPHTKGVLPDAIDPQHDTVRYEALWGNLMAGGAGAEWYFGYKFPHTDLNCEDWRSRDKMWDQTRYALEFFHQYLPFDQMEQADQLASGQGVYVLAKPNEVYALYLPAGQPATLDLSGAQGSFQLHWYNPREGGPLQSGTLSQVEGGNMVQTGAPPTQPDKDWVVLIHKK